MRIGIIGSGNMGATAARLFARTGHDVPITTSRGPDTRVQEPLCNQLLAGNFERQEATAEKVNRKEASITRWIVRVDRGGLG